MTAEIPHRANRRGGPGWWMDGDGVWQPPTTWPENYAPIDGWIRDEHDNWAPPPAVTDPGSESAEDTGAVKLRTPQKARQEHQADGGSRKARRKDAPQRSRQAEADIRAMLLVGGAIGFAILLLLAALVMQSRAGAAQPEEDEVSSEAAAAIVFAAETEQTRNERRREAARSAPQIASNQLAMLATMTELEAPMFSESTWGATAVDCLDVTERVLVERSAVPVSFADNFECVPSEGSWFDPYLDTELTRTIDAEVRSLVPLENVHYSGGFEWTPATRERFVTDTEHPATMVVLAADSGHNPRNATPDQWRPADPASWCGYAVDWISVKARWELSVSAEERTALADMLETCDDGESNGPHLSSMVIDASEPPTIDRMSG